MRKREKTLPQFHCYYIIIINAISDIIFYDKLDAQQFQDDCYHEWKMQRRNRG